MARIHTHTHTQTTCEVIPYSFQIDEISTIYIRHTCCKASLRANYNTKVDIIFIYKTTVQLHYEGYRVAVTAATMCMLL